MPFNRPALITLALLALASAASGQTGPAARPLAIMHAAIIDTGNGSIQRDRTILVRDGRIARIDQAGAALPADAEQLDARGAFAIPGLWDLHVHLSWATVHALPVFVANGVTVVRDLGSDLAELDSWRTRMEMGALVGPRILRAGPMLNGRSSNPWQLTTVSPEQSRGIVRALKQVGVDFIKVHRRVPRDAYFAITEEARAQGLSVVGHIPLTVTPEEASDAGQLVDHVETLFEGTFATALGAAEEPLLSPKLADAILAFRAGGAEALFARFVRNRTPVTPVLDILRSIIDADGALKDPRVRYVPRSLRDAASKQPPLSAEHRAMLVRLHEERREVVRMMSRAGVVLLAGTDTATAPAVPGVFLHEELAALVAAGLTPLQALQAATLHPARVMKREGDLGSITTGKVADVVLLNENPLVDIRNTQRIQAVVVRGKLLRRPDLDALLKAAEQSADQR